MNAPTSAFLLAALCVTLGGCGLFGDDPYVSSTAGLHSSPPRPFVAGRAYDLRVSGQAAVDATFASAMVYVFRGGVIASRTGLRGDTLAAVPVGVTPGSTSFDTMVPVAVPADAVDSPSDGWIYVEYEVERERGCETVCTNSTGSGIELVPAP